jgi:hypothetical protein
MAVKKHYRVDRRLSILAVLCTLLWFTSPARADPLDNWHLRHSVGNGWMFDIAYGNGTFVAVGKTYDGRCRVATSRDGVTWTETIFDISGALFGVTYGYDTFVAVGADDVANGNGVIVTSSDGLNWTDRSLAAEGCLYDVAWGENTFVAVGMKVIQTSPDGIVWTVRDQEAVASAVTYGDNIFVAGEKAFYTSADGINWVTRLNHYGVYDLKYGDDMFVAVGWDGSSSVILTSVDGVDWASKNAGSTYDLLAISHGHNTFVIVGVRTILTSSDGVNWIDRSIDEGRLEAVTYGNNTFVAVSNSGEIFQSDSLSDSPPDGPSGNDPDKDDEDDHILVVASCFISGMQGGARYVSASLIITFLGLVLIASCILKTGARKRD